MQTDCIKIPNEQTGYFSKIVVDYLKQSPQLQPFYNYPVSIDGIKQSIEKRKTFKTNREVLVAELKKQYAEVITAPELQQNIQLLSKTNTFTITTAHQPNIFTGPLYFIYKILHVIKLANYLNKQLPQYKFVPVYYIGSEDADLDELNNISIRNQQYVWDTKQTGAVGRMKVDSAFTTLIENMHGQIGVDAFGEELISIFKTHYTEDKTIQQATLGVANELFGNYGLVTLIPDNAELKKLFNPVIEKELLELFSHHKVDETLQQLKEHHKVQAGGRDLNLFYLLDDKRERIELRNEVCYIAALGLRFSKEEILRELQQHPERFSANVILRGVYQETVLPNIAFIGGGGELAYWLELKKVFEAVQVPYPVLILRNSFLLLTQKQQQKIEALGFKAQDFFKEGRILHNIVVKNNSENQLELAKENEQLNKLYNGIKAVAAKADTTLQQHVETLKIKAHKCLLELEKKMLRAEKRKFEAQQRQIIKLKNQLFPNNNLQERVENFAGYYSLYGKEFINMCLANSLTLEQEFMLLTILAK